MYKKILLAVSIFSLVFSLSVFIACDDDDTGGPVETNNSAFKVRPNYLPTLTPEDSLIYELWVSQVDTVLGLPVYHDEVSLGQFFWDDVQFQFMNKYGYKRKEGDVFNLPEGTTSENYEAIIMTIEPYPDESDELSENYIFTGDIIEDFPVLEVRASIFEESEGLFTVATLTDYDLDTLTSVENAGLWFAFFDPDEGDPSFSSLGVGLLLPIFSETYAMTYEGWVYHEDWPRPLSLGKFRNPMFRDYSNDYNEDSYAPIIPGEDFLRNTPRDFSRNELEFPLDLIGVLGDSSAVFITLEPYPDKFPDDPFPMIVMSRNLPFVDPNVTGETEGTHIHEAYQLGNRYPTLPQLEITRTAAYKDLK